MKLRNKVMLLGSALGLIGLGFVFWSGGVVLTIGVLLAMWGNNIERRASSYEK